MTRLRDLVISCGLIALSGCGRLRFEDLSGLSRDDAGQRGEAGAEDEAGVFDGGEEESSAPETDAAADAEPSLDGPESDTGALDGGLGGDAGLDARASDAGLDAQVSEAGLDAQATDAALDAALDAAASGDVGPDAGPRVCGPGLTGPACDQCVRYVDLNSSAATPNGLTWQTAFKTILEGEGAAFGLATGGGPSSCQVWVREGRYFMYVDHPINGIPVTNFGPLYGGFAGTESQLSQRNLAAHTTVIDGASPDGTQHVVNPVYGTSGGYLDGFTVTGARNTSTGVLGNAGGIDMSGGTTTLRNMTIQGNACVGNGAGLYVENTRLIIEDSRILGNTADGSGGGLALGAGVSGLTLRNVVFSGNVAGGDGGAVYVANATATALMLDFSSVSVAQNTAGGRGGAFYLTGIAGTLTAISTGANTAGASASGCLLGCSAACTLSSSIFWDPSALAELSLSGTSSVVQSIVRGGAPGVSSNISTADPRFVSNSDLHLSASSPAIDAANGCAGPEKDLEGQFRVDVPSVTNQGVAPVFSDQGAYEYQLGGTRYPAFDQVCP
jgi:predicted outer membrane repeat protein